MKTGGKVAVGVGIAAAAGAGWWWSYGRLRTSEPGTNGFRNVQIACAAAMERVSAKLLKAVCLWESDNFKYAGRTHPDGASHGLTGITIGNAKKHGYTGVADGLNDDWTSLRYGAKALRTALDHAGGDEELALTMYNHGESFDGVDDIYVGQVKRRAAKEGLAV